ncbi:MAG: phosphomannomutase/phosphoglucomutase [Phycisphaerae bacterium]|nr:phosphomannomutase/phosphoglucomutase [Phycisphaerae bacterium]
MVLEKIFKAYDIRGLYGEEIDEDLAWKIGHASAQFLRSLLSGYQRGQAASNRLVVGRDMRPHSEPLCKAMIDGITSAGIGCVDIGLCDTPMIYFAINHLGTCGGIQVTASHNPMEYNGFKISGAGARPVGRDTGLKEVQHIVSTLRRMPAGASLGHAQQMDLWDDYRNHVLRFLRMPRPLKVVVDASNGMGGKMIPAIFEGTDIDMVPLNWTIGEGFAHSPNPLVEANLAQLKKGVVENDADMGICLDGDADRCMFVDEQGNTVRCDLMTALLARYFLKDNPAGLVVYDLRSSKVVAEEIRAAGGTPRRERVGHAFMKKAMTDGHGVFGGELSGHFYFADNYNCDSGAIVFATAVSVLAGQDEPFSKVMAPLNRYSHSGEINFEVEDKQAKMNEIAETFSDAEVDHLDGVTVQYADWWCNVRPSNTEPLLRLSLEAADETMMTEKLEQLKALLGEPVDH